jgi:hypothetical protein
MMRINPVISCSMMIAALASAEGAMAQNRPAAPAAPAAATNTPAPAISGQADRLLREMGAYIGSAAARIARQWHRVSPHQTS